MTDNIAILDGYTASVMAESTDGLVTLFLLVKPDTEFDSWFKAWDTDQQEWLHLAGWLFSFERLED